MKFPFLKTNNKLSHPSGKEKNVLSTQIRNYELNMFTFNTFLPPPTDAAEINLQQS